MTVSIQELIIILFIFFISLASNYSYDKWYIPFILNFLFYFTIFTIFAIIGRIPFELTLEDKIKFLENYLNLMKIIYQPNDDFWKVFVDKVNTELIINEKTSLDDIKLCVEKMYVDYLTTYYISIIIKASFSIFLIWYFF